MNDVRNDLVNLARIAPLNGYVKSGYFSVIRIKEKYNISDYYVVEILEDLLKNNEIRDLEVNYDRVTGRISSYGFK